MENYEGKSVGQNVANTGKSMANASERLGKRVAEKIGGAADTAGQKIDAAVDYVDNTTRGVREGFDHIREEGWDGVKRRTMDYTRQEPFYAILIAAGAGLLLGWLTKRGGKQ